MTSIILIAHKYPPFKGVGANRWWHISRELANLGVVVHVLTVARGAVPFIHENVIVHQVASDPFYKLIGLKFSSRLLTSGLAFIVEKLRSLFWYDDEAQYWGRYLLPKIEELVNEQNVNVIIATGHPFQSNRWAAFAKQEIKGDFRLIQDIRDPWGNNPFKKYVFNWQRNKVKNWEKEALNEADANVFVTKGLMNLVTPNSTNSYVIENAHSFYCKPQSDSERKSNQIIVHAGTLANGRDVVAEPFFKLCLDDPEILHGKEVHFYGRISLWLLRKYKELFDRDIFVLHEPVNQEQLANIYSKSVFALQFNALEYPYLVSTKIYEHPAFGLPTLSLNRGGAIDELITENKIGVSCQDDIYELREGIKDLFNKDFFDSLVLFSREATFKKRANDYLKLINRLKVE